MFLQNSDNNPMKKRCFFWSNYRSYTPFVDLLEMEFLRTVRDPIKATDILLFEGGTDISASLYGEPQTPLGDIPDSLRDALEKSLFRQATNVGALMLGICRGSQFLTAMNGGKVIQHCDNHTQYHWIQTSDKKKIWVSSTHHQMMNPFSLPKKDYKLLAWAYPRLSTEYLNGYGQNIIDKMPREPEVVWYPKTKCLCIQGHPEYMRPPKFVAPGIRDSFDPFVEYCRNLVQEYLLS